MGGKNSKQGVDQLQGSATQSTKSVARGSQPKRTAAVQVGLLLVASPERQAAAPQEGEEAGEVEAVLEEA